MYLQVLLTTVVEALQATFDSDYPQTDFRNLKVSMEYPVDQIDYPGIWLNYDDTDELRIAGIDHREYVEINGYPAPVTRWRFGGTLTFTIATLSSLERARLYDEMVRVLAFARVQSSISDFREVIENNDLVAMNANFDTIRPSGDNAAPGTPWGTDEFIYERSLSIDLIGEFVSEPDGTLVNLSEVIVMGYPQRTPEPPFTGQNPNQLDPGDPGSVPSGFTAVTPHDWH
jgi:hypothetical protein